jgi:hypothetical protein
VPGIIAVNAGKREKGKGKREKGKGKREKGKGKREKGKQFGWGAGKGKG